MSVSVYDGFVHSVPPSVVIATYGDRIGSQTYHRGSSVLRAFASQPQRSLRTACDILTNENYDAAIDERDGIEQIPAASGSTHDRSVDI